MLNIIWRGVLNLIELLQICWTIVEKKVTIAQYAEGKYKIEGSYRFWTDEMFEEKKKFNGLEV